MQSLGKIFLENIIWVFGYITAAFVLIKVLKDYQDRKAAESRERSVGEKALQELKAEIKRLEDEIKKVDDHCDERDRKQSESMNNFFQRTWQVMSSR